MRPDRCHHRDEVDVRRFQNFIRIRRKRDSGMRLVHAFLALVALIADNHHFGIAVGVKVADDVRSPIAVTNNANSNHRAPWKLRGLRGQSVSNPDCLVRSLTGPAIQPFPSRGPRWSRPALRLSEDCFVRSAVRCLLANSGLGRTFAGNHCAGRLQKDLKIQPDGPSGSVFQVQTNHLIEAGPATSFALPQTGYAWRYFQYPPPVPKIICLVFVRYGRPWAHKGHFAN